MTDESLARALGGHRCGAGWILHCPNKTRHVHGDRTPSLSVREVNGKVLVNCFVCPKDEVIAALKALGLWSKSEWTPAQRREFAHRTARDERDLRAAQPFGEVATILSEWILEQTSPSDRQRAIYTRLLGALRTQAGTLAEYRAWRERDPRLTAAMVEAGRRQQGRMAELLRNYLSQEAHRAA